MALEINKGRRIVVCCYDSPSIFLEDDLLVVRTNLANAYAKTGRFEDALRTSRNVYSGSLKLYGKEHPSTLHKAYNTANTLISMQRFEEAKSLLRQVLPVARRVLGEEDDSVLMMRSVYAQTLCQVDGATLDDLREAVTTFEDTARIARRMLGGAHPLTQGIENDVRKSRAELRHRETPPA